MRALFGKKTLTSAEKADRILLFDLSNLAYRCAHGYSELSHNGMPSGHVFGAMTQILTSIRKFGKEGGKSLHLVFALDGRPDWKYELYNEYKGNRTKVLGHDPAEDVATMAGFIPNSCSIINPDEEADDIIGAFLMQRSEMFGREVPTVVITSDKDMWQLKSPTSDVYTPTKKQYVSDEMIDSEFGVPANCIPLFKALHGDPSDNIKGVYRLQKKAVRSLIAASKGKPEAFFDQLDQLTEKTRKKIEDARETIEMNYKIAKLKKGATFSIHKHPSDIESLKDYLQSFGCSSLLPKLGLLEE